MKEPEKHKYPTRQNPGRFWNPCRTHFLGLEKRTCPGKRGRLVTLINGDNKLAHIKLPAMAAGGAGGKSGKTYSFKVVLLGEGCVGKTSLVLRYCEYKFNDKHITTLQERPGLAASSEANRRSENQNSCVGEKGK